MHVGDGESNATKEGPIVSAASIPTENVVDTTFQDEVDREITNVPFERDGTYLKPYNHYKPQPLAPLDPWPLHLPSLANLRSKIATSEIFNEQLQWVLMASGAGISGTI